jgi:hypothetical protein
LQPAIYGCIKYDYNLKKKTPDNSVKGDCKQRGNSMVTKLFMDLKKIFADLASTLILGKNKDAAGIALLLSEKSKALADELAGAAHE